MIKWIKHFLYGHEYKPIYEQRFLTYKKGTQNRHIKSRFKCEICKKKTKWLNKKQKENFMTENFKNKLSNPERIKND